MLNRRGISLLLLVVYLPACTSFQATTQPIAELTASPKAVKQLRITTTDGVPVDIDAPRVVNDSLFGTTATAGPRGEPTTRAVALPLAQVRSVEVRKSDGTKTMMLAVGVVGALVLLGVAASHAMDNMFSFDGMSFAP